MRACWLKWVGRDWSISADYIWLNYSGANIGKGLTGTGLFLTVPTVMRPCDGTSGLVRGNRLKAVFALRVVFQRLS